MKYICTWVPIWNPGPWIWAEWILRGYAFVCIWINHEFKIWFLCHILFMRHRLHIFLIMICHGINNSHSCFEHIFIQILRYSILMFGFYCILSTGNWFQQNIFCLKFNVVMDYSMTPCRILSGVEDRLLHVSVFGENILFMHILFIRPKQLV